MADQFPSDIMYKILSRMPVKSLARLRCVSKLWCNYINDPYFKTMHAQAKRSDHMFIMFQQSKHGLLNSRCTVSFLEYKEEKEEAGSCTREVQKKPVMDIMCKNHTFRDFKSNSILLGSCNGLLFTSRASYVGDGDRLIVIHPLRKECYELPPLAGFLYYPLAPSYACYDDFSSRSCGLGFDNSTQTFKMVLCLEKKFDQGLCTMVHVLGTTSWRQIPQVPSYPITGEGVFANGCLYWLVGPANQDLRVRVLISFDMAKEEFGLVDLPVVLVLPSWKSKQLVDLHGQLGYVCDIVQPKKTVVWILKERGWVRHCEFKKLGSEKVLGFCNEDGDLLMKFRNNKLIVYKYGECDDQTLRKSQFPKKKVRACVKSVNFVGWKEGPATDILWYQSSLYSIKFPKGKYVSPLSVLLGD